MNAPAARTLDGLLREWARRRPDGPAVVAGEERPVYRELLGRALGAAARLRALGVRPGDRVGLLADNRAGWLDVCFGAALLGAPLAAFNTWVTEGELDHLLRHSGVRVLVAADVVSGNDLRGHLRALVPGPWDAVDSARYPALRAVTGFPLAAAPPVAVPGPTPGGAALPGSASTDVALPGSASTDVALVLYTSGSTARPKAVPLLHGELVENGFGIGERMGLTPDDRVWLGSPLFWSFGSANALMATVTHGATLVLQAPFEPAAAVALMERERCTAAYLLPTITRALLPHAPHGLRTVRTGLTIGAPAEVRLAAEGLGVRGICNVYGATETYGNCAVTPHDAPLEVRLMSQGPPLPGVRIRVVDPRTRAELPPGEVGELEVTGHVTPGYHDGTPADDAAFTADGHYRTGDLGRLDKRGWLRFAARASELIRSSGINVSPAEVEERLRTHPAVAEVAVVGVPDERAGEAVVAFVVPVPGAVTTPEELRAHCRAGLASYKTPSRVVLLDELPRTPTGKLSRRALRGAGAGAQAGDPTGE
ncbi:MAG TPA: class I adenylate-forming enzyme family protein, partial [Pseudonocardiaceae bacterium]